MTQLRSQTVTWFAPGSSRPGTVCWVCTDLRSVVSLTDVCVANSSSSSSPAVCRWISEQTSSVCAHSDEWSSSSCVLKWWRLVNNRFVHTGQKYPSCAFAKKHEFWLHSLMTLGLFSSFMNVRESSWDKLYVSLVVIWWNWIKPKRSQMELRMFNKRIKKYWRLIRSFIFRKFLQPADLYKLCVWLLGWIYDSVLWAISSWLNCKQLLRGWILLILMFPPSRCSWCPEDEPWWSADAGCFPARVFPLQHTSAPQRACDKHTGVKLNSRPQRESLTVVKERVIVTRGGGGAQLVEKSLRVSPIILWKYFQQDLIHSWFPHDSPHRLRFPAAPPWGPWPNIFPEISHHPLAKCSHDDTDNWSLFQEDGCKNRILHEEEKRQRKNRPTITDGGGFNLLFVPLRWTHLCR